MASWSEAMGYLPTRPGSLALWKNQNYATPLNQVAESTHSLPPSDILTQVTSALSEATVQVIKNQLTPIDAVDQILTQLANP